MTENEMLEEMRDQLSYITSDFASGQLERYLRKAKRRIFNYCNIEVLPVGLEDTAIDMACELYKHWAVSSGLLRLPVVSITEADRSISYKDSAAAFDESLVLGYTEQLNRYRRMGVVRRV